MAEVGVGFQFAGTATRVSAAVEPFDGRMGMSINELRLDVESPALGPPAQRFSGMGVIGSGD